MPKLLKTPESDSKSSHSEMLPWLCHASPEWILCKDGSILSALEYKCLDIDNNSQHDLTQALSELQTSLRALDERFYIWWIVDKKRDKTRVKSVFPNAAAQKIDDNIGKLFDNGNMFDITYRMYVLYTGETGMYAFMDNVRRLVNEENASIVSAMLRSLNPATFTSAAALSDARQLDQNIAAAEGALQQFINAHTIMRFNRLQNWELDNALVQCANVTLPLKTAFKPPVGAMLDSYASLSDIKFGREAISVSGPNKTVFSANLSLKDYPTDLTPGLMEDLISMQSEFRLTHVMRCLGQAAAVKTLKEVSNFYFMNQSSFMQRAIAKATSSPPVVDPGKAELYEESLEALRRQMIDGLGWLYHAMTVTVFGGSLDQLEQEVNKVSKTLSQVPFIRERLGLKASFYSMLPGQWSVQQRLMLVNAEVAADCAPIYTVDQGSPRSLHLSETTGTEQPSMSVFRTRYGTPYHYNPHVGQLGHTLLVMPSGGGKTTFANLSLMQFQRYPDAQVFIFDRNFSCRIATGLVEGTHVDLKSGGVRLNPMAAIQEGPMGRLWAREFLLQRLEEGGSVITPDDRNVIDERLLELSETAQPMSMSTVAGVLPKNLQSALAEWVGDGPYAMFDSEVDELSLESWTCIEMKDIMAVDRLARAFLDHAFRVIMKRLDGRPTFIYLEEASFLLNSPTFLRALDDWLKTFRKLNAFVWLTIQSPEAVSGIDDERVRATIADNIPNLILGYNQRLENHRALYKAMFGMHDEQINILAALKPKRDYLLVADGFCRILGTSLSKDTLAYLRSEQVFQNLFTQAQDSDRTDWREWYIAEALTRG